VRKRAEVDPVLPDIPVVRQCELLDLSRSTFYYLPTPDERLNQELMRRLDEEYTKHPFFGSRKLTVRLRKAGFAVNRKRIVNRHLKVYQFWESKSVPPDGVERAYAGKVDTISPPSLGYDLLKPWSFNR
jgi:putative transposase